ncbi:MAG TPA: MbcA/ParS/Xre antitoxin family protein, partial [Xanthobacteraceae bacterium]|nr:MbcA/ParS/Xre antitoxin family protein [Xanthobacteraceae bacterium]
VTDGLASAQSSFLPTKIATAVPWLLVGAIVSAVLASCLSGDVRRTDKAQRVRDVISLGIAAALAAGVAQLIQGSLAEKLGDGSLNLSLVPVIGLAGFACGAVIGFTVPVACRVNLVTPLDPIMARALRDLLGQAEAALGSKAAAENWVFMPHTDLGGITPAEAVQHKTHATGVRRLLESEAAHRREEARQVGLAPVVIEGGLSDHRPVDARAAL